MSNQQSNHRIGRRAFLQGGTLFLAGPALSKSLFAAVPEKPTLRLGLVTDIHYADKNARGRQYYRESLVKVAEAAKRFDQEKPDVVVELGDLIDGTDSVDVEKRHLRRIAGEFAAVPGKHHYVLGNHCVNRVPKPEFLEVVGQAKSFYSFDANGYHFVVLDACFTANGTPYGKVNVKWGDANIPPAELEWLQADLLRSPHKSFVFIHQCLDVTSLYAVKNAPDVRNILEKSGKVLAVLQGHFHSGNYQEICGIHYCTLRAVIEGSGADNNAYAMMDILPGDEIRINGFRKQPGYRWG